MLPLARPAGAAIDSGRLSSMRLLKRSAVGLFLVAVPLALIGTNVRVVINAPVLYSYGFDRYDIPYWTGIERSELLSAAGQIRDYFNNNDEFLDLNVFVAGIRRGLYSEREVLHMKDVKGLVKGVYRVEEIALTYLAIFAVVGLVAGAAALLGELWAISYPGRLGDRRPRPGPCPRLASVLRSVVPCLSSRQL